MRKLYRYWRYWRYIRLSSFPYPHLREEEQVVEVLAWLIVVMIWACLLWVILG